MYVCHSAKTLLSIYTLVCEGLEERTSIASIYVRGIGFLHRRIVYESTFVSREMMSDGCSYSIHATYIIPLEPAKCDRECSNERDLQGIRPGRLAGGHEIGRAPAQAQSGDKE